MPVRRPVEVDDGFTIVEVLVALAILLIACVALLQVYAFASVSTNMNATRGHATDLANERIERIRNIAYDSVGTAGGDPAGTIPEVEEVDGFTVTTDVSWARDAATGRASYKHVDVRVSWTEPRDGVVSVSTNVYGASALVNTGDVVISVMDRDTGEGIENVSVSMTPSTGAARVVATDENGEAFFGFVPTGEITVSCSVSGYLVDLSSVSGAEVTADTLTRLVVYAQRPSTGVVHVTSMSWVDIPGATVVLTDPAGATRTVTTGSGGIASFDNLLIGNYSVAVSASGRISSSGSFAIAEGDQTVTCAVRLADPAPLTVIVKDPTAAAVKGVTVNVYNASGAQIAGSPATTADSGAAAFSIPASGNYTISISKAGYVTQLRTLALTPAGSTENFTIQPILTGTIVVKNTRSNSITVRLHHVPTSRYVNGTGTTVGGNSQVSFPDLATGQYYVYRNSSYATMYVSAGTVQTVTWGGSWQ